MTAAIHILQTKKEAQFICSACGADRSCDCNAPAIERLARKDENQRQNQKAYRDRKREEKQHSRYITQPSDPIEEECADCNTEEERWQRSIANIAGDAISVCEYWTRQFGDWEKFEVPSELATLAKQAAEVWTKLAKELANRER